MQLPRDDYSRLDGYELFRRAIVERDQDAWQESNKRFRPLLIVWAKRCPGMQVLNESADDIADQALARAWVALSPERFGAFPNLAALLAYLRTCVRSAVMDTSRRELQAEPISPAYPADEGLTPEEMVLKRMENEELWRVVYGFAQSPREKAIIECFVYGLKPQAVFARHTDLFTNIGEVYAAKRNLFERLQRHFRNGDER